MVKLLFSLQSMKNNASTSTGTIGLSKRTGSAASKYNWILISSDAALKSKWATEAIANSYFIT
jgi:hypothetical protein